jgi:hypothetical protein
VERLADFCRDVNVLITGFTYADEEYPRHLHWGHSSVSQAGELAWRARALALRGASRSGPDPTPPSTPSSPLRRRGWPLGAPPRRWRRP